MENVKDVPVQLIQPLEKEEVKHADYNATIVRDYYGQVDPFYLSKKDPNYEYRFLRDEPKNLAEKTGNLLFQKGGWQIVPRTHLVKLGIKEREISPDGMLRRGDTILSFMPRNLFEEKHKHKVEQTGNRMKEVKRNVQEGDSSATAGIHESMDGKGIQTKKQLGM